MSADDDPDSLAAQFRPSWEAPEQEVKRANEDDLTARPQPAPSLEDATVRPQRAPDVDIHNEPTVQALAPEFPNAPPVRPPMETLPTHTIMRAPRSDGSEEAPESTAVMPAPRLPPDPIPPSSPNPNVQIATFQKQPAALVMPAGPTSSPAMLSPPYGMSASDDLLDSGNEDVPVRRKSSTVLVVALTAAITLFLSGIVAVVVTTRAPASSNANANLPSATANGAQARARNDIPPPQEGVDPDPAASPSGSASAAPQAVNAPRTRPRVNPSNAARPPSGGRPQAGKAGGIVRDTPF